MTSSLHSPRRGPRLRVAGALALALWTLVGCSGDDDRSDRAASGDPLAAELADALRVDLADVEVTLDYRPAASRVEGTATLRFEMRPGETRPLFHFNPLRRPNLEERELLTSLELDGEPLDPADGADLRRLRPAQTAEPAFEIQRRLDPGGEHTLRVEWSMPKPSPPSADRPWFFATFDDTEGPDDETETLWPTVSSPEELARHRIRLRVHSKQPYVAVGSGATRRVEPEPKRSGAGSAERSPVQEWEIDTGRAVASHTVFFAAVPAARFDVRRFQAGGVNVKLVSNRPSAATRRAEAIVRRTIPRLIDELGEFPMSSVQILLTGWGSGMEYYGASRTGLGSLVHELGHMYFGVSTVNRTWRDTWLDEAAVSWWEERGSLDPVKPGFSSSIGAGSAVAPGFDESAYGAGARVLESIARALGGDREMLAFLADLHARRQFEPFTTDDFIDDVVAAQDSIDRDRLERWLKSGG